MLPHLFDKEYTAASVKLDSATIVRVEQSSTENTDVQSLQREIERLKLEAVSREQDVMELRSQLEK
jgi:hypothetical protein